MINDFIGVDGKVLEVGVGIGDNILFNSKLDGNIMDDGYSVWLFINLLIEENEWLMLENDVCNEQDSVFLLEYDLNDLDVE